MVTCTSLRPIPKFAPLVARTSLGPIKVHLNGETLSFKNVDLVAIVELVEFIERLTRVTNNTGKTLCSNLDLDYLSIAFSSQNIPKINSVMV